MTVVPPNVESTVPRRGDRLNEAPSGKNAQGLFLPSACIFVGNLSTKVPVEQLAADLKTLFDRFGTCWPKIKQGKKKDLPGAFVQFERVEDASAALACEEGLVLHDRPLRVERIKGRRTAVLGLRSGGSIAPSEVSLALGGRGPLEASCYERHFVQPFGWVDVCKITFVYVDDCRDAIKFFSHNGIFFMKMFDTDASPTLPDQRHPGRGRPPTAPMSSRNGNGQRRWSGSRPQRGGPGFNRGGFRAHPKFRPPFAHENIPPFMGNGMPYSENHPPFFPPPPAPAPLPPHSNAGYTNPPFVMDGLPAYTGAPFIPPPPAFAPVSNGPLIVGSQPGYSPLTPPYYGEQFHQDHGYFGPHPNMNFHPGAWFPPTPPTPAYYGEYHPQNPPYFSPPEFENKPTPPSTESSTVKETETTQIHERVEPAKSPELLIPPKAEEQKLEEPKVEEPKTQESEEEVDIFNLPNPETPPRLIRVYQADSESDEDDDEEETPLRRRSNSSRSAQAPSLETVLEEPEEDETEESVTTTTLEPASGSDSESAHENRTQNKIKRTRVMRTGPYKERSASADSSRSVSRGRSRTRKPLAAEYQPTTGVTVEEYVRDMVEQLPEEDRPSKEDQKALVVEIERERLKKFLEGKFFGSESSSRSRSGSVETTSSSKSL